MKQHYVLVLLVVAGLTILCGAGAYYLAVAYDGQMSNALAGFQQSLTTLFSTGAGTIFGLLGGKALAK